MEVGDSKVLAQAGKKLEKDRASVAGMVVGVLCPEMQDIKTFARSMYICTVGPCRPYILDSVELTCKVTSNHIEESLAFAARLCFLAGLWSLVGPIKLG